MDQFLCRPVVILLFFAPDIDRHVRDQVRIGFRRRFHNQRRRFSRFLDLLRFGCVGRHRRPQFADFAEAVVPAAVLAFGGLRLAGAFLVRSVFRYVPDAFSVSVFVRVFRIFGIHVPGCFGFPRCFSLHRHFGFFGKHQFLRFRRQGQFRLRVRRSRRRRRHAFYRQFRGLPVRCLPFFVLPCDLQGQDAVKVLLHVQRDDPHLAVRIVRAGNLCPDLFPLRIDQADVLNVLRRLHRVGHVRADHRPFGFDLLEADDRIRVHCRGSAVPVPQDQQCRQHGACDQQRRHQQLQPARCRPCRRFLRALAAERLAPPFQVSPGFTVPAVFIGILIPIVRGFLPQVRLRGDLFGKPFLHPSRRIADRRLLPEFLCQCPAVLPFLPRRFLRGRPRRRDHRAGPRPAGFRPSRAVRSGSHPPRFGRHAAVRPLHRVFRRLDVRHGACFRQVKPLGIPAGDPVRWFFFRSLRCFRFFRHRHDRLAEVHLFFLWICRPAEVDLFFFRFRRHRPAVRRFRRLVPPGPPPAVSALSIYICIVEKSVTVVPVQSLISPSSCKA